jgi:hypothetical protein
VIESVPAPAAPEAKEGRLSRLASNKGLFVAIAAVWTAATGVLGNLIPGWLSGPPLRTIQLSRLSVDEVSQPPPSSAYRLDWVVRVHYDAAGLEGAKLKFVTWLYDAQTNARIPRVESKHGMVPYSPDIRYIPSGAATQRGLVRLSVPLPTVPGSYYIAVAVFGSNSANGEYDFLRSKRLKLTQHDLTRIGKIFGTS